MARRAGLVAAIAVTLVAVVPAPARAAPCEVATYPGDGAAKVAIAQWMAYGANGASMPRELPVMGALAESGLPNAPSGGNQPRLTEAQALIEPPCPPEGGTKPPPPPPPPPAPPQPPSPPPPAPGVDAIAPLVELSGARRQHGGVIVLSVRCPAEPCTTSATAALRLPRAKRALTIAVGPRALARGQARKLRFVLAPGARRRVRAALRSQPSLKVSVRVLARDLAGNASMQTRTVRLTR